MEQTIKYEPDPEPKPFCLFNEIFDEALGECISGPGPTLEPPRDPDEQIKEASRVIEVTDDYDSDEFVDTFKVFEFM